MCHSHPVESDIAALSLRKYAGRESIFDAISGAELGIRWVMCYTLMDLCVDPCIRLDEYMYLQAQNGHERPQLDKEESIAES